MTLTHTRYSGTKKSALARIATIGLTQGAADLFMIGTTSGK
jgi:hypothetical protein